MAVKAKLLFILIGDDKTGKTTFQKLLIQKLNGISYDSLKTNLGFKITHPEFEDRSLEISYANRSYQEKPDVYKSVNEYFTGHFNPKDIAVISSHLNPSDVEEMIRNGKERFYNVIGVFFTNSMQYSLGRNSQISALNWDARLIVENPVAKGDSLIDKQLDENAESFVKMLIEKTKS